MTYRSKFLFQAAILFIFPYQHSVLIMMSYFRLATLKHSLPLVESLNEGLTDLIDWITQGEQLVEDGRMGRSADIQKYAEDLQVISYHLIMFNVLVIYSEESDCKGDFVSVCHIESQNL